MNRNTALVAIVALVLVAIVGTYVYRQQQRNTIELSIGKDGVKVEGPAN